MSNHKPFITFDSAIPDESKFSESGDIVVPCGRNVMGVIIDILQSLGFETSPPSQHEYYGWEILAKKDWQRYWFLLQYPEPWLLIAKDRTGIIGRIIKTNISFEATVVELNKALVSDSRFTSVQSFTKDKYEKAIQESKVLS